jgi:FADH2 O2-dependent halogenase
MHAGSARSSRMHMLEVDVAIIGSGFAGSLTALALRRRGFVVALLERGRHPRFAIGESSTPLANLLLERIADEYDLPRVRPFSKWGTWQRSRPDIAVGLKRGFSFFFHRSGEPFGDDAAHERQLLVAASPHDGIADTHWYRPAFDEALVREGQEAGAIYLDDVRIDRVRDEAAGMRLEATRDGQPLTIAARFVVDASGPRGCLHHLLGLQAEDLRWMPPTQALYTHFEGVERWDRLAPSDLPPPFPVDDAAVHHVFDGGWMWMLRFNNGLTSAGVALTEAGASSVQASEGARAWARLLQSLPSVRDQFEQARPTLPFRHAPRVAFRSREIRGSRWALLPSAAGVIDPLLSTGFPLTLLGIRRLLTLLENTTEGRDRETALQSYETITRNELEVTERLVAALYANLRDPLVFKRLTLLYFAAASYAESAQRLDRPELAPGFLLHAHSEFSRNLLACCDLARPAAGRGARQQLLDRIDRAIEPFDVAGLLDRSRRDWYPVLAPDLVKNAFKLKASPADVDRLLERSGFFAPPESARIQPA